MLNDNLVKRKYFFWDNFSRNIEQLISDFNTHSDGRFIDDFDKAAVAGIDVFLRNAQMLGLKRYHSALGEFIQSVEHQQED